MDKIDRIFYINLDERVDRLKSIHGQMLGAGIPPTNMERVSAVKGGQYGCVKSHIECFRRALDKNYENILILEDDFIFSVDKATFHEELTKFFGKNIEFNALMLSYKCYESSPYDEQLCISVDSSDASGYVVNRRCFGELIRLLEEGITGLLETQNHWLYMNDRAWLPLHKDGKWFLLKNRVGMQNEELKSDIGGTGIVRDGDEIRVIELR